MIVTRLTGGLGNQMFQYAAGFALAARHRTTLKLDLAWFSPAERLKPHERYGLDGFRLTATVAAPAEIEALIRAGMSRRRRWSVACARLLRLRRYVRRHSPPGAVRYERDDFRFAPEFTGFPDGTYLHGNWQSARYFLPVADAIHQEFAAAAPLPPAAEEHAARLAAPDTVCVHVRRGDYAHDPAYTASHGGLDAGYYRRALAEVRRRAGAVRAFVFSDEPAAAAALLRAAGVEAEIVAEPPGLAAVETLALMRRARHFVIANSTLGWWAAWLGRRPESVIVAPDPWFAAGGRDGRDIVPEDWIRLARRA